MASKRRWQMVLATLLAATLSLAISPRAPGQGQFPPLPTMPAPPDGALVRISAPRSGESVRGMAKVFAEQPDTNGTVIFRVDDQFAFATSHPFVMRWDTKDAAEGEHTIQADAYDPSYNLIGSDTVTVRVDNAVPDAIPADGLRLVIRFREGEVLTYKAWARGTLEGAKTGEVIPAALTPLAGQLTANIGLTVLDAGRGGPALVRVRLRNGLITFGATRAQLPETRASLVIGNQGLAAPPTRVANRPRVGLGEIGLLIPSEPLREGDAWDSRMTVVVELQARKPIQVMGSHTFQGVWWYDGEPCARINSTYTLPTVPLVLNPGQVTAQAPAASRFGLSLTQGPGGMGGRGGMMGGMGGMGGPGGMMGGMGRTGGPGAGASADSAQLVGLSGTRTTWISLRRGKVVRTEDRIEGSLSIRTAGAGGAPTLGPQGQLPEAPTKVARAQDNKYGLSLTQGPGGMGGRGGMMGRMGGMGGRAGAPGGATQGAPTVPQRLDYTLKLTTQLSR